MMRMVQLRGNIIEIILKSNWKKSRKFSRNLVPSTHSRLNVDRPGVFNLVALQDFSIICSKVIKKMSLVRIAARKLWGISKELYRLRLRKGRLNSKGRRRFWFPN